MAWNIFGYSRVSACALVTCGLVLTSLAAQAQVEPPNKKYLFTEDTRVAKRLRQKEQSQARKVDHPKSDEVSVDAPDLEFEKGKNEVIAKGGAMVSKGTFQLQADQARVNMDTKDTDAQGNILVTGHDATISADAAQVNLETETGTYEHAQFAVEEGGFNASAFKAEKLSEFEYHLTDSRLSSCQCEDGVMPWSIRSSRANITQEGYAHTYGSTLEMWGLPVMYAPYFPFPAKFERQTGLLAPKFGFSSRDGTQFKIPLFINVDESTDLFVTPFVETQTRTGSSFELHHKFSRKNEVQSRWYYSDESARGDSLRGTVVSDPFNPAKTIHDPTFDQDRFGGFYSHVWQNSQDDDLPLAFIADGHYVSDDLFSREIEDNDIAEPQARYATSRAVARTGGQFGILEAGVEYNQSLLTDDDLVFQKLPELRYVNLRSFRPFGYNPYGVKLVAGFEGVATDFSRTTGFDGWRENVSPSLKVPFHVRNYINGDTRVTVNHSKYQLDRTERPGGDPFAQDSFDRSIYNFSSNLGTTVERVFDLDDDSWLTTLSGLGVKNQNFRLTRLKNEISPFFNYSYVPKKDQTELPIYDSFDRIRQKNLVIYGFKSRLLGRFMPAGESDDPIPELTPRVEDLPMFEFGSLADVGRGGLADAQLDRFTLRKGAIRDLVNFSMRQAYDFGQAKQNQSDQGLDERSAFSDIESKLTVLPSASFAADFGSNFSHENGEFSSWFLGNHIHDDRGDVLRYRLDYVAGTLSQGQTSLEVVLTDRLKFGYYSRYDARATEFLESKAGLRLLSSCNCWNLDLDYRDRLNPDSQQVTLTFTFKGLGDISQGFSLGNNRNDPAQ